MAFTNKQRVFIEEYLKCWNATVAALKAGYSEKTARSMGAENLTKPDIKAEIDARIAEKAMSADEVLIRLGEQARGDIGEFLTFHDGIKLPLIDIAKAQDKTHLIKKLKYRDGQIEFELHDAQSALVQLGKHHGLFTDKVEHSGKIESPIQFVDIVRPESDE